MTSPNTWPTVLNLVVVLAVSAPFVEAAKDSCTTNRDTVGAIRSQLQRDLSSIRNMGFQTNAETLESWASLAETSRHEVRKHFADAFQGALFASADHALTEGTKLNPWNVNTVVKDLRAKHLLTRRIETALRNIASERGKPLVRRRWRPRLKELDAAITAARWDLKAIPLEQVLEGLKTALSLALGPVGGVMVAASDSVIALTYTGQANYVIRPAVERLSRLVDRDLRTLSIRAEAVRTTTGRLNDAKKTLAGCEARQAQAGAVAGRFGNTRCDNIVKAFAATTAGVGPATGRGLGPTIDDLIGCFEGRWAVACTSVMFFEPIQPNVTERTNVALVLRRQGTSLLSSAASAPNETQRFVLAANATFATTWSKTEDGHGNRTPAGRATLSYRGGNLLFDSKQFEDDGSLSATAQCSGPRVGPS